MKRGPDHAIGRSRGGLSTKIHAVVDEQGRPVRLVLSAGQATDKTVAPTLIETLPPAKAFIADHGYDARALVEMVSARGGQDHIPTQSNVRLQRSVDPALYRQRNVIERFFNKLKHFRRIATRFDKLARNFLAAVALASTRIWIRTYESTTWLCPARPGQQKRRPEAAFSLMGWPAFRTTTHQDRYIICFGGSGTLASVRAFSRTGMPAA